MNILQSLTNRAAYQSLRATTLTVTGTACTLGGLVADVLQPVAPFATYLFVIALLALAVLFLLYRRGNENLLGAVAFAAVASAVFGLIVLFQSGEESEDVGILAALLPAVANLQSSLGIIDAKLDAISADTQSLRASADRLETQSEQVLRTLDEMREGFASGGVIARPQSPEDHYHNARLHELGGDYSAARRSYLAYFQSDLPLLDPHLRFLSFLKVQEGTAGARETYRTLMAGKQGGMPEYVRLLLLEGPQRMAGLLSYAESAPTFAPVWYHLSEEVSARRLGVQTLANKRDEQTYLQRFTAADDAGGLLRYIIDQSLVEEWREDAARRLLALDSAALESPVDLNWSVNNAGYTATVSIAEPALEIVWNIRGETEPRSTGTSGAMHPQTGRPAPQLFFNLPANQRDATIEIRYRDANSVLQGPFAFPFKGRQQSADANRRILESTNTSWVSFRDYNGKRLLYFSHLMTYRGSIAEIR
ncbi:MAG: hypothetical protein KDI09_14025, partial [Halioglobus sp.]|nr:hypothetical protein [Halioglobus sp.]